MLFNSWLRSKVTDSLFNRPYCRLSKDLIIRHIDCFQTKSAFTNGNAFLATTMLVTDVRDEICWCQV